MMITLPHDFNMVQSSFQFMDVAHHVGKVHLPKSNLVLGIKTLHIVQQALARATYFLW